MDRFFLVYRVSEAHRKAALERQQFQEYQHKDTSDNKTQSGKTQSDKTQSDKTISNQEEQRKQRFENDFVEWVYKMVNC